LQGLVALGALSQPDNKDLQQLAQSTRVTLADKQVTARLEMPVAEAIAKVKQGTRKKAADPSQPAPPRRKPRRQAQ
jgi:hypothetical protein